MRIIFLLILTTFLTASDISKQNKPPTVRVLLTRLEESVLVEVRGRYLIYNPKNDELIATGSKKKRAKVTTWEKGIYWDEEYPDIFEMRIVPNEESASILVNGIQYKGCIEIYSIGGTINVVNEVDTENYLKSVLGPKVTQKFSRETLDAIAITERTHLYYLLEKDAYASWQIEAEKVGYTGLVAARQNSAVAAAIERTNGLILNYKKKPFAASWSENNAGRSVTYNTIFRKNCTVPSGVDNLPSLFQREKSRWKSTVLIKNLAKIADLSTITKIDLFRAEKTKKIYAVRFFGPEGKKDISFFELQQKLGETTLPSNDFTLNLKGNKAFLTGYGKGLGVGLCGKSAEILAQRKASTENILKGHFPGSELLNLREETGVPSNVSFIWK